jgi:hypothetical protein
MNELQAYHTNINPLALELNAQGDVQETGI